MIECNVKAERQWIGKAPRRSYYDWVIKRFGRLFVNKEDKCTRETIKKQKIEHAHSSLIWKETFLLSFLEERHTSRIMCLVTYAPSPKMPKHSCVVTAFNLLYFQYLCHESSHTTHLNSAYFNAESFNLIRFFYAGMLSRISSWDAHALWKYITSQGKKGKKSKRRLMCVNPSHGFLWKKTYSSKPCPYPLTYMWSFWSRSYSSPSFTPRNIV
jgi:hypothetical protein